MMMDLRKKIVLVIGLADSGAAAARFLAARGARVRVTDLKTEAELADAVKHLSGLAIEYFLGGHPDAAFAGAELAVVSPGVPKDATPIKKARARGIEIVSELEFAARHVDAPIVAVTGTNGKSTVVSLIGHILQSVWGESAVFVGGNLGTPFIELPASGRPVRAAVVEVSSFQLEFADSLHPRVAVILNITPDHLDRYRDFAEYGEYKWRLFANQGPDDYAVVNIDAPEVARRVPSLKAKIMTVSLSRKPAFGMCQSGDMLEYREPGQAPAAVSGHTTLHGAHNLMNVMAALCAARAMGIGLAEAAAAAASFSGLAHRLELVREFAGVKYFDDSKATNAGAVEAAVLGLAERVRLLMGGQAKGCSFTDLGRAIKPRAERVYAFGECREQLHREIGPSVPVTVVETLAEALAAARADAAPGEAVLLAPACASFDQFKNYKHRGDVFRALVMELS